MSGIRNDRAPSRRPGVVFGLVLALIFLLGLFAFHAGLSLLVLAESDNRSGAVFFAAVGALLTVLSLRYFYRAFVSRPSGDLQTAKAETLYPDQPWMARPDWAARRVEHTSGGVAAALWIWTIGWWGFLSFIGWVNHDKIVVALAQSWWNGTIIAVFVGAGLVGLAFAVQMTTHWWRYGASTLRLDTLPAYLGETFRGALEARLQVKPREPLSVELVCEKVVWVTTGHGKDRSTRRNVKRLGVAHASIPPATIVTTRAGTRSEVEIQVPDGLPEFALDERGNGVRWVLNIATTGKDQAFSCAFEVPIFGRRRA